jgi:glycosyltransferase involved in cell wall biosynthesis
MTEVAIIMPTYKRPISLPYAIESVLAQTFNRWKLYVVGDGDTEEAERIVKRFQKRAPAQIVWHNLPQNHGGVHTNKVVTRIDTGACPRNTAFFMSKEPYIAYLDDDDSYRRDHIQLLYKDITSKRFDFTFSRGAIWRKPNITSGRALYPLWPE